MSTDLFAKILELLRKIKEQGLSHECAMEGYIEKYGCADCTANIEKDLLFVIEELEKFGT